MPELPDGSYQLKADQSKLLWTGRNPNGCHDGDFAAEAHFDWDRTGWGVIYGSSRFFARLGMHVVFDPISIQLRIVFA